MMAPSSGVVAHTGVPGPAPFIATGLFFVGLGAAYGAYWFFNRPASPPHRAPAIGLGVIALGCFVLATIFPIFLGARPSLGRPSTVARLQILAPRDGEMFRGEGVSIPVALHLERAASIRRVEPFARGAGETVEKALWREVIDASDRLAAHQ